MSHDELQISWNAEWERGANNISTPSNYRSAAIERSTYPPLVPVQLLIRERQRTPCLTCAPPRRRLTPKDVCLDFFASPEFLHRNGKAERSFLYAIL